MTIALTVMNMTLIVPVIPDYADFFGVSLAAAASLVSVFAAGRLVSRFWGGLTGHLNPVSSSPMPPLRRWLAF